MRALAPKRPFPNGCLLIADDERAKYPRHTVRSGLAVFPFARGRFASAEAARLQCFEDFLSPLLPNCIYYEEGRQWV